MKQIIIFGNTDFARQLTYFIETDTEDKVVAYTVNKEYAQKDEYNKRKLIPYEELSKYFCKDDIEILIAIGYKRMNDIRKHVFEMCKKDNWKIASYIHSSVNNMAVKIGEGNIVLDDVKLRFESEIGDGNILLAGTCISHNTRIGNFNYFAGGHIGGFSIAGNNNFVGIRGIIQNGVNIGDYNLIGAGACLNKTIKDGTLVQTQKVNIQEYGKDILCNSFEV